MLDSRLSDLGSSASQANCVVLGNKFYYHSASLKNKGKGNGFEFEIAECSR